MAGKTPAWLKWMPLAGAVAGLVVARLQNREKATDYLAYGAMGGFIGFMPQIAIVLSNKKVSNETSALSDKEKMKREILAKAKELEPNMKSSEEQAYKNLLDSMTLGELTVGYLTMKMQADEGKLVKTYPDMFDADDKVNLMDDPNQVAGKLKEFAVIARKEYGIELTQNQEQLNEDIKGYIKKLMGQASIMNLLGAPSKTT
jgi:hypothetical protein